MILIAYTKIKPIKSEKHLQQALDYILNPAKTYGKSYTYSFNCTMKNAVDQFRIQRVEAMKKGNNVAHHICQSFSPEDNINPEKAINMGIELMKRMYPGYQYVLATHVDRGHIHNHFLINAVSFDTHKKIVSNINSLKKMRKISDDICIENGLSIISPELKSHRDVLKLYIDEAVENANCFDDFLKQMRQFGYTIKMGKHIAFKGKNDSRFIRSESIGTAYTEFSIKKRLLNEYDSINRKRQIYDDKAVKMSQRKKLRKLIDFALKSASDYTDFLKIIQENEYAIKHGKHLAMKHISAKKFIRVESLGEDYSEDMLKLYFDNYAAFIKQKDVINDNKISRFILLKEHISNRYVSIANTNTIIKILNYLEKNDIRDFNQLLDRIEQLEAAASSKREKSNVLKELEKLNNIIFNIMQLDRNTIDMVGGTDYSKQKIIIKNQKDLDNYRQR